MSGESGISLAAQLKNARKEIDYYKQLAAEAGKIRLRETEELSTLISQLRTAKQDLEQERLRFQTLVEQAPYALVLISSEGRFLYANPNFLEMFGYSLNEITTGRDWFRKAYPDEDYRHKVISVWLHDSDTPTPGKNRPRVFKVTCKGGEEKVVQFNAVQLPSGEDLMTCEDITRRINAERTTSEQYTMISRIFENASEGICVCHNVDEYPFVRFSHWNRRMRELTGYTIDDINTLGWYQTMYPDPKLRNMAIDRMKRMRVGDDLRNEDWTITTKEGEQRIFSISTSVLGGLEGQTNVLAVMRDTTEQKKAEQQLKESESNFRSFFEAMEDIIVVGTPDGRILYSNPAASRKLGFSADELQTMHILELHPRDLRKEAETIFESMFKGERHTCPLPLQTQNGLTVPVETRVWFGKWSGLDCIFGICKDLSKEQEALQKFNRFFHNNPCPMAVSTIPNGEFVDVNDAFLSTFRFSTKEVIGNTSAQLNIFPDPEAHEAVSRRLEKEGRLRSIELTATKKDGTTVDGLFSGEVIESQGQKYFLTVMLDISERKRMEDDLRQSEARYKFLTEAMVDIVWTMDLNLRITYASPSIEQILGYTPEERKLMTLGDIVAPESLRDIQRMYDTELQSENFGTADPNRNVTMEIEYYRKDGSKIWLENKMRAIRDSEGTLIGIHGLSRDVTDRKKAEQERENLRSQLLQSQKMEAVGTLAAGIAHDFNNMLQVILGYSDMLLAEKNTGDPGYQELQKIVKTSIEARDLVQKIRIFSRKADMQLVPTDLNHQISELVALLSHTLLKAIDIDLRLGENLAVIRADPALIHQMATNLSINALEAMPDGGTLTIATQNLELDEDFCALHAGANPGPYVEFTVSDTGRGMTKELVDRIFEPFFSTKQRDYHRGTGLGLSIVQGIVEEHNGFITVQSQVGRGTSFTIYLPALTTEPAPKVEAKIEPLSESNETILLVEDEELVRDLGIRLLERFGYKVIAVSDGQEAVEAYARQRDNIALVILDIVMPRMNGKECLQELLKIDPAVKVLISSGVAQDDRVKEVVDLGACGALLKPYSMKVLKEKVREILDSEWREQKQS